MGLKITGPCGVWMVSLLSVLSLAAVTSDLRIVEAVRDGDRETVRSLLEQQVDVNAPQPDGATALHWAAHLDERFAQWLASEKANGSHLF